MAEVTKPIILDETAQDILTALQSIAASSPKVSYGTTDLTEGTSDLETGSLYIYIDE